NAAAVVGDRDRVALLVQGDRDAVGVAVEVLIDGVIDDLPDEVVQPGPVRIADVHGRSAADGLEALEDGDVLAGVARRFGGSGGHGSVVRRVVLVVRLAGGLLFVAFGEDGSGRRIDDVVRAAACEQRVGEVVVHMPAIGEQAQGDLIPREVPVGGFRVE